MLEFRHEVLSRPRHHRRRFVCTHNSNGRKRDHRLFLRSSTFPTNHNESNQEERESSQEGLPTAESNPLSSISSDSAIEPSPGLGTPEEEEIQSSEFFSQFEDNSSGNIRYTLNHPRHKKLAASLCLYETLNEVPQHAPIVDWSKEVEHIFEAIQISSSFTTIHCSMKGNIVEALHDPTVEACIIPECLLVTLVGKKPLTLTNKYLRSPLGLFFDCWGIARDMPITIDKIKVCLDFHIFDILDFDLLLGYLLDQLLTVPHGSQDENLKKITASTAASRLENLMARPLSDPWPHDT